MTPKDQPVDERLAHVLENILGQNYVDEYSGSDRHIGVDEIATQLLPVIQAECNRARKQELESFEPLPEYDHVKCIDPKTCIGYENARSDFDNEKELRLEELQQLMKGER